MVKNITVYKESRKMCLGDILSNNLGVINDNEYDTLYFKFDEFVDGTGVLLTNIPATTGIKTFSLTKVSDGYQLILDDSFMVQDEVDIQLKITNSGKIWHSRIYKIHISPVIN